MALDTDDDEFDGALEGAIGKEPEAAGDALAMDVLDLDTEGDDDHGGDEIAGRSTGSSSSSGSGGGGDIDDDPPIDRARSVQAELQQAEQVRDQWRAERERREQALKAAQLAYKEARKKVLDGLAEDDAEIAAHDAVMSARYQVDKATDSEQQAEQWRESLANAPQLAPAQQAWLDANPGYQSDQRFQAQAKAAMRELVNQGYDPTHQAFYRRLDNKLRESPRMGQGSRRAPNAPAIRTSKTSGSGDRLSQSEAGFLRKIGLNPAAKNVQAEWRTAKQHTKRIAERNAMR